METAIMKSILESFYKVTFISDAQLQQIENYLFKNDQTITNIGNTELESVLEYIKELVVEHSLITPIDLMEYCNKRKEKHADFINNTIEETSNYSKVRNPSSLSNLRIPAKGSFFLNSLLDMVVETERHSFKKSFSEYLEYLSNYFMQLFGRTMRSEFAHLKPHTIDLDCIYTTNQFIVPNVKRIKRKHSFWQYFEKFSTFDDRQVLVFWKPDSSPDNCDCKMLFLGPTSSEKNNSYTVSDLYGPNNELDELMVLYDNILSHIQREEPITNRKLKYEIINWLLYSKLNSAEHWQYHVYNYKRSDNKAANMCAENGLESNTQPVDKRELSRSRALYRTALAMKKWTILKSPPGHTWLTSDNPGFGINLSELGPEPGELMPDATLEQIRIDTLIYYPLTSEYCLRIRPDSIETSDNQAADTIEFEESTLQEWKVVNGLTFTTKNEVVVSKDKNMLEELEML